MDKRRTRVAAASLVALCTLVVAVDAGQRLGVGQPLSPVDTSSRPAAILPDGRGLPTGHGTAADGKSLYEQRCASCHGLRGTEGPFDPLAGGRGTLATPRALKTVGSFWPYATTLWDYISRTMPYDRPGSLSVDETYAITAYVLHLNDIVAADDAVSHTTLPQVRMPNRDGFIR